MRMMKNDTFKNIYFVNFATSFLILIINCSQNFTRLLKNKTLFPVHMDNIFAGLIRQSVLSHPHAYFKITTKHAFSRLWVASVSRGWGETTHTGVPYIIIRLLSPRFLFMFQYLVTVKTRDIPDHTPITLNSNTAIT
jgi:hypothetical protein